MNHLSNFGYTEAKHSSAPFAIQHFKKCKIEKKNMLKENLTK